MLDYALNSVQKDIRDLAKKFAQKEIAPVVEADEANSYFRKELFPKFGAAGLLGITVSSEWGGAELGLLEYALILEEFAYYSSGYAVSYSVTNLPTKIIEYSGTDEQKKKYLPKLISGEHIGAFALTEPSSGSDASSLKTTAKREGNYYILNGSKQFITNGEYADVFLTMARTGGHGTKGVSAFIVEKSFAGVKGGKFEKKMGMRVSPTQEIHLENVRVPVENLVGGVEENGMKAAFKGLDGGRISIAAIANGLSRAALDKAVAYAREREQFGKKILEFQGVSFLLADMATELESSVVLTRSAAAAIDVGQPSAKLCAMAKLKATETCMRITTDAVQVLGGYGYMEEYQVERYMREAKMLQIVEGTSQIQRIVIARNLT